MFEASPPEPKVPTMEITQLGQAVKQKLKCAKLYVDKLSDEDIKEAYDEICHIQDNTNDTEYDELDQTFCEVADGTEGVFNLKSACHLKKF